MGAELDPDERQFVEMLMRAVSAALVVDNSTLALDDVSAKRIKSILAEADGERQRLLCVVALERIAVQFVARKQKAVAKAILALAPR